jgi:hypothetical protein
MCYWAAFLLDVKQKKLLLRKSSFVVLAGNWKQTVFESTEVEQ